MLRLFLWNLILIFTVSEAFAGVSVYVDMKQTGPTDSNGQVQVRVGKNVNATYSASAGYNGQPTLNAEEEISSTAWTHVATFGTGAIGIPTGTQTGSSATITAKSADAGTYSVSVTFNLTFTIKMPQKDGSGNYVYVDGVQQFTTRTDGPYTGSGSATLTVTPGKFKVRLEPDDKCQETTTNKRNRTRFGLGETGDIILEPETQGETVVFIKSTATPIDICTTPGQQFILKNKPGSATITVKATVTANGVSTTEEETIGITAIAPTGMVATLKVNDTAVSLVGSGMYAIIHFNPKDVSFSKSILGEGEVTGTFNGTTYPHAKNQWPMGPGDVVNGTGLLGILWPGDRASWSSQPLGTKADALVWNIPFGYYDLSMNLTPITVNNLINITINSQIFTFDGQGGCVVTKFGWKATRVPNNVSNLLNAVKNNTPYTDGWKYID